MGDCLANNNINLLSFAQGPNALWLVNRCRHVQNLTRWSETYDGVYGAHVRHGWWFLLTGGWGLHVSTEGQRSSGVNGFAASRGNKVCGESSFGGRNSALALSQRTDLCDTRRSLELHSFSFSYFEYKLCRRFTIHNGLGSYYFTLQPNGNLQMSQYVKYLSLCKEFMHA